MGTHSPRPGAVPAPTAPACPGHPFPIPDGAALPRSSLPRRCRCDPRTPLPAGTDVPERLPSPPVPVRVSAARRDGTGVPGPCPPAAAPERTPAPSRCARRTVRADPQLRRVPAPHPPSPHPRDPRSRPRTPPRPTLCTCAGAPSPPMRGGASCGAGKGPEAEIPRRAEAAEVRVPGSPRGALRRAGGRAPRGFFVFPHQTRGPQPPGMRGPFRRRGEPGPGVGGPTRAAAAHLRRSGGPDGEVRPRKGGGNETGGSRQDFSE